MMSKTKGWRRRPIKQMHRDVNSQDRRLYGKNKQTEMSMTWQSQVRQKDDEKMKEEQKQETSLLFAITAVTLRLLCHFFVVSSVIFAVCPKW